MVTSDCGGDCTGLGAESESVTAFCGQQRLGIQVPLPNLYFGFSSQVESCRGQFVGNCDNTLSP